MSLKINRPHLTEIRDKNKVAILGMLRSGAAISRPEIAESLNLSLMSVSRLVKSSLVRVYADQTVKDLAIGSLGADPVLSV